MNAGPGVGGGVSQGAPCREHPGGQLELRQVWAGCLGYFPPGVPWQVIWREMVWAWSVPGCFAPVLARQNGWSCTEH